MKFVGARKKGKKSQDDEERKGKMLSSAVDAFKKYAAPVGRGSIIAYNRVTAYNRKTTAGAKGIFRSKTTALARPSEMTGGEKSLLRSSSSLSDYDSDAPAVGANWCVTDLTTGLNNVAKAQPEQMESGYQMVDIEDEPLPLPTFEDDMHLKFQHLMSQQLSSKRNRRFKCDEPACLASLRLAIYSCLEEPKPNQPVATSISLLLFSTIVFSITCMVLETMPELYGKITEKNWYDAEVACTIVFTTEYVVRLLTCDVLGGTRAKFMVQPMNLCDMLAILPFYLQLLLASSGGANTDASVLRIFRMIRMVRLFRIMKLARYSSSIRLMAIALVNSLRALWVLVFFLILGVVLFSSAIYYSEKFSCPSRKDLHALPGAMEKYVLECADDFYSGVSPSYGLCCDEWESPLDFPSIPDAFWWSIVTMTTVGYGDVYPRTSMGKVTATFTFLSGILLIALPVAIVGRKFTDVYDAHTEAKTKSEEEKAERDAASSQPSPTSRNSVALSGDGDEFEGGEEFGSTPSKVRCNNRPKESICGQAAETYTLLECEGQVKEFSTKLDRFWVGEPKLAQAVKEMAIYIRDSEDMHKAIHSIHSAECTWAESISGKIDMVLYALHQGIHRENRSSLISNCDESMSLAERFRLMNKT